MHNRHYHSGVTDSTHGRHHSILHVSEALSFSNPKPCRVKERF